MLVWSNVCVKVRDNEPYCYNEEEKENQWNPNCNCAGPAKCVRYNFF